MKLAQFCEEYGISAEESKVLADILDIDLTGLVEVEKAFSLRARKGAPLAHKFNAVVRIKATVKQVIERAVQPVVINWQNKNRQGKKETLADADRRLEKLALQGDVNLEIRPLSEREQAEVDADGLVDKLDVSKLSPDKAKTLMAQLEALYAMKEAM
jgi:hypothetical protein